MNSISTEKKSGISMQPTTNRAHLSARGLFLITAFVLAQHLAVSPMVADTPTPACPCSIWSASIDPGPEAPDTSAVNLGIKFQSDVDGYIKAIRFYKHPDNTGTHIGYLWSSTGTQLGSATFTNETATGWQEVALSPAVPITANTTYVASYYAPNSHWPHNLDYFQIFGADSPPLHVAGGSGNNGVYAYGSAGLFPNNSPLDHPTNYMVDVVFEGTSAPNTTPPTVTSITPVNAATGVDPNTNIDIHFSKEIDASSINGTTVQLRDSSNAVVAAAVIYPQIASTPTATFIPTPVLALSATYTVVVKSGSSGVKDLGGVAVASDFTATFTTAATAPTYGCPCTVWTPATDNGGGVQGPDNVAQFGGVNLGLKFQSDASGYIKGIRFYKQPSNTGTHTAFLWNASGGPALASATFSGESATGWQEIRFLTPVAITRHTTYIAAYHTEVGYWAQTRPYFETSAFVNTPLRASQYFFRNPNSVYAYGAAGVFPNQDPNDAPNYWIDFIFDTSASDGTGNNIAPTITSANATSFTVGTPGTFTVTTSGNPTPTIAVTGALPGGVTFVDNANGSGTLSGTPASGSGGTYALTFTATNTAGNAQQNFTLTVNEAPSITTAAANTTVCDGSNATFTAAASGYPAPALQWRVSTDGGSTFTDIGGATTSPLTFPASLSANGNRYRAHFTNSSGFADTTAQLTVNAKPAIPAITAPTTVTSNSTGNSASGPAGATTYAWSIVNGVITSSATIQTITFTAGATGTTTLGLTVTNINSCSASNSVAITINHVPSAVNDSYTTNEDTVLTVSAASGLLANDSDVDGNTITAVMSDTWTSKAAMTTARSNFAFGAVNGILYAAGGWTGSAYLTTNQAYDPATNTWTSKAAMPTARELNGTNGAAGLDGKLYVIGGNASGTCSSANEAYNPGPNSWQTRAAMPTARCHLGVAALNGIIYAIGGTNTSGSTKFTTVEAYDPAANTWTTKASLTTGRQSFAVAAANGKLYVISGSNASGLVATVEAYDPTSNTWTAVASLPTPRSNLAAAVVNGIVYAIGGYNGTNVVGTVESYDPATNLWTPRSPIPTIRQGVGGAAVNGIVYAAGGGNTGPMLTTLESLSAAPAHGGVTLNTNGSFTYTPVANYNGPDSFTYKANDGNADSAVATVNITVTAVNDPPVFTAGANVTVVEDSAAYSNAWATAIAPGPPDETGTVSFTVTNNNNPLFSVQPAIAANGTLTFTPAPNGFGTSTVTVVATDDGGASTAPVNFTITITGVNDPPVAVADSYTTNEDTVLNVPAPGVLSNDSDPDLTTPTAVLVTGPTHGTLTLNANGSFVYTPTLNYNGSDSFIYRATDGTLNSANTTVTLTINPVQDPPTINNDNSNTYENLSVKIVVLANDSDVDGDTLTVSAVTQGAHGSITINADNSLQYVPALNYNGTDSFTYTASDGHGGTGTATVNVTIKPVNSAPTANADSYSTPPNTTLNVGAPGLLANDTDPESDPLTAALTVSPSPSQGSATVNSNGSFSFTPATNFTGIATFKYKAADTGLVTSTDDTTMDFLAGTIDGCTAIRLGNGDVMLTPASPGMVEAFTGTALPTTWSSNIQTGGSLTVASGLLTLNGATARFDTQYQPAAGQPKVVEFVATFAAATANQAVGFGTGNAGAILSSSGESWMMFSTNTTGDQLYARTKNGSNTTNTPIGNFLGAAHRYRIEWSTTDVKYYVDGVLNATHTTPLSGNGIRAAANDDTVGGNALTVDWLRIGPYTSPCTFLSRVFFGDGGTWQIFNATVNLPTNTNIVFETRTGNVETPDGTWSGFTAVTGSTINSPNAKYLQYRATLSTTDGSSPTIERVDVSSVLPISEATVTITVNTPPVAANDSYSTCQDHALTVNAPGVLANDTDADSNLLTTVLVAGPAHATSFTLNANGSFSYTPASGYSGGDSFTYKANDGFTTSATATVNITVNATPATPTASNTGPYCEGATIQLNASTIAGATYAWTGPNGFTSNLQNPTIANATTTMSGTYSVIATVNGCTSLAGITTVVVNATPATPTISAGGPTTFCQGGSVTFTSSSASGNQWFLNGVAISGATGVTYSANASGDYTVQVTTNNCPSAFSTATTVSVTPLPPTPTISAGGPTTFCQGGSVTLSSTSATGNQWYRDGIAISSATNQTYTATLSGNYTAIVTANGCPSPSSNGIGVIVNPIPATPTINAGGPTTFCQGGSVTLTSSSSTGNQWFLNGSAISGATAQTYSATGAGDYTVQVTSDAGCVSATSAATTVTVNSTPATPTINAGGPTTFCQGGSVTLTSSATTGNQWFLNGAPISGATAQTYSATSSGDYTVQVTSAAGCPSATSAATTVTVNAIPAAPTVSAGGPTTFCQGGSVMLSSTSSTGNQWFLNGVAISGATNQTYTASTSGTYTAVVTSNGCSSEASNGISVTVNSIPAAPTVSASGPTTFCQGGSVTLSSTTATGNQWYRDGIAISGATGQTYSATTSGTYTAIVTSNGCASPASNGVSVTVNPTPATPTINAGGPTTFCQGGSVTLTSSSSTGNQWFLNGSAISGATAQTYPATSSGDYSVQVTSAAGCVSARSTATTVTVNPIPVAPTVSAGGPTTFCQGGSVTLSSTSAAGNQWFLNGVAISGATAQTYTATTSGNYTATVTSNGCTSPASNGISVTVNPIPAAPTVTAGGPTTFCQGGSVTLSSTSGTGNQWYRDGVAISGATAQTYTATTSGTYTATVTSNGCASPASNGISVTVNPTPATPTINAGGPTTFCQGGSVTLTSSSTTGNQWFLNGSAISGATAQTYSATSSGDYTVQVTSAAGCVSGTSAATTVTVNPIPAAPTVTAGGPTTFCQGGSVTLSSTASAGNQWYRDGVAISGATAQTFAATTSGNYTAVVTSNGCASPASNGISVTVNPTPATPTISAGGPTTFCQGGSVTLTSSSTTGNQWYLNGGAITGATNQTYTATSSGDYTVKVTSAAGCVSAMSAATTVTVNANPATPTITAPSYVNANSTGNTASSSAATTYAWTISNGSITSALNIQNITFTAGASGQVTLNLTVTNASGCQASNSTNVPINRLPVATNDTYSVLQNNTLNVAAAGVLTNDTDADGNSITAVLVQGPAHSASFTLNADGSFNYTPTGNYYGSDSFTYKASDTKGYSNVATASIDVYQESVSNNNVPLGGSVTTDTETPPDGATSTNPLEATVTLAANQTGSVSISTGKTQPSDVPPTGYSFFDYEVDITATTSPAATASNPLTFVFLLDPSMLPAGQGKDSVKVFRNGVLVPECAGAGATPDPCVGLRELAGDDIKLTIRTSAASRWSFGRPTSNTAPTANNDSGYSTQKDTPLTVPAPGVLGNDTDPEGNVLTAIKVSDPAHGSVVVNSNGSFTYTPTGGYIGGDSFTYKANDATYDSSPATVSITVNAPPSGTLSINDVSIAEGNPGGPAVNAIFTVTLSAAATSTVTVQYATAPGTATAGSDYTTTNGTLTFSPGDTTKTISVPITLDANYEQDETFYVNLSNAVNATIADGQGVGTITNDDAQPTVSIGNYQHAEGNSGYTPFPFAVTLSAASYQTITVQYYTSNSSAIAGSDYVQVPMTTLTFTPGETSKTVTVQVIGDTAKESNELFVVTLTNPVGATLGTYKGWGTILTDD